MNNELMIIHNYLMQVEAKGDSAVCLAEAIVRLRKLMQKPEQEVEDEHAIS